MKGRKSHKRPSSTPMTSSTNVTGIGSGGGAIAGTAVQRSSLPAIHFCVNLNAEERAAIKIQACFKGFYTKKLRKACIPGKFSYTFLLDNFCDDHLKFDFTRNPRPKSRRNRVCFYTCFFFISNFAFAPLGKLLKNRL